MHESNFPSKRLRFALLGYGKHAELMRRAFSESKNCELVAIGTATPQKISLLQEIAPEVACFSTYEEALADEQVEAVLLTLPNHLHATWATRALTAYRHVLCEKPLATHLGEAQAIWLAAEKTRAHIAVGFAYRMHPQHQKVRALLKSNTIGEVEKFESVYAYQLFDKSNIRLQQETGGGILLDAGCYPLDAACFLTGLRPSRVQAKAQFDKDALIDTDLEIELEFGNHLHAFIRASSQSPRENWYRFSGSEGTITCRNAYHVLPGQKTVLELQLKGKPLEVFHFQPCNPFALELDAFATAVTSAGKTVSELDKGVLHMELIDAVQAACRQHA